MPINHDELMRALMILADEDGLKVFVKELLKGGMMAGAGAMIGGAIAGPLGLAVGGGIGSCLGAYMTGDKLKPLSQVIKELDRCKQQDLYNHMMGALRDVDLLDAALFVASLRSNVALRTQIISHLVNFIDKQLSMAVKQ